MKICTKCKSENVEFLYWVNVNTKEVGERYAYGAGEKEDKRYYCGDCMDFTTVENKE